MSFPGGSVVKNPAANAGDLGSLPGLGRSSGGGNDNPLQYSCLESPMDRGGFRQASGFRPWGCKESDTTGHAPTSSRSFEGLLGKMTLF